MPRTPEQRGGRRPEGQHPSEKTAEALARLEQGIGEITDSEAFGEYLKTLSKFHEYSFGNALLIHTQKPDATRVAGYNKWRELGRQVGKGERGIRILVPYRVRVEETELVEGEPAYLLRGFGVGHVFDVSQTEGEPLPEPPATIELREATDAGGLLYEKLRGYLAGEGLTLERSDTGGANGYYDPRNKAIAVSERLTGDQATKTLLHETAHYTAEHHGRIPREDAETVAEASAYVVLSHFGIDSGTYTFPYVAGWAKDKQVLRRNLEAIQRTSHALIGALEAPPRGAARGLTLR